MGGLLRIACMAVLPIGCAQLPTTEDGAAASSTITQHANGTVLVIGDTTGDVTVTVYPPGADVQPPPPGDEPDAGSGDNTEGGPGETEPTLAEELLGSVIEREGWETEPYDHAGHEHICVGHLTGGGAQPLSNEECISVTAADMEIAMGDALTFAGADAWERMSPTRKAVVAELALILGLPKLIGLPPHPGFTELQAAIRAGDYRQAALEIWLSNLPKTADEGGIGRDRTLDLMERMYSPITVWFDR